MDSETKKDTSQLLNELFISLSLNGSSFEIEQNLQTICGILGWRLSANENILENSTLLYNIAFLYLNGIENADIKDSKKGVSWLQRAADLNDSTAINDLACLYLKGLYVERSFELATDFFAKAAALGDASACFNLASLYRDDSYQCQNIQKAIMFFEKGAALNDIECIRALGCIYLTGENGAINPDPNKAEDYFKQGEVLKDDICIYNLGYLYQRYSDVFNKDILYIKEQYEKSVNLNNPNAMLLLADLYLKDKGSAVQKLMHHDKKYLELIFKAAELGNKDALDLIHEMSSST